MPNKSNIQLWLALKLIPRLATQKKLHLVKAVGIQTLFERRTALSTFTLTAKQQHAIQAPDWVKIDQIIERCAQCQCEIITFDDPNYPQLLKETFDPPLVLFVKGSTNVLNTGQIAMIGSRSCTASGRDMAKNFAQQLVQKGLTITSGLALGIDANAHRGALNGRGITLAVVATGLDTVYPTRHKALMDEIIANNGAIVSEFFPGTPAKAGHFPRRNRIISGMSYGVLVVEAAMKSGSLITARTAMEQNRDVFAIPSAIYNEQARGCHWLIKQGAKLVENCADIIEELPSSIVNELHLNESVVLSSNRLPVSDQKEQQIESQKSEKEDLFIDSLLDSVGYELTTIDVLVSRSKLSTEEVLTRLTMLELGGLVTAVPGGYLRL